jgi:hypothetical protein
VSVVLLVGPGLPVLGLDLRMDCIWGLVGRWVRTVVLTFVCEVNG